MDTESAAPLSGSRPQPGNTTLTAIVVTWNRRAELERCLQSLRAQTFPERIAFEIAVLDDGSTDGTAEYLATLAETDDRIVPFRLDANHGPGVARNVLLRHTRSDFLLLIDSDAYLQSPADALARLVRCLEDNPRLLAASGIIYSDADHVQPPFFRAGYMTETLHADLPRWRTDIENPHFLSSCFSVWRREPIESLGGYDPFYGHGIEDVDVTLRLARRGWRFQVLPDVAAVHEMSREGRRRPFDDFDLVFRYMEWTRPYLHLRLHGWWTTARAALRWPFQNEAFVRHYGRPLGWKRRALCQILFPALHLALWPWYRWGRWRRNFLRSAPTPR